MTTPTAVGPTANLQAAKLCIFIEETANGLAERKDEPGDVVELIRAGIVFTLLGLKRRIEKGEFDVGPGENADKVAQEAW